MAITAEDDAATEALIAQLIQEDFNGAYNWNFGEDRDTELADTTGPHGDSQLTNDSTDHCSGEQDGWAWEHPAQDEYDNKNKSTETLIQDDTAGHQDEAWGIESSNQDWQEIGKENAEEKTECAELDEQDTERKIIPNVQESFQDVNWTEPSSRCKGKGKVQVQRRSRRIDWNAVRGDPDYTTSDSPCVRPRSTDPDHAWDDDQIVHTVFRNNETWCTKGDTKHDEVRLDETLYKDVEDDVYYEDEGDGDNDFDFDNELIRIPLSVPSDEEGMVGQEGKVHEILLAEDGNLWSLLGELLLCVA